MFSPSNSYFNEKSRWVPLTKENRETVYGEQNFYFSIILAFTERKR